MENTKLNENVQIMMNKYIEIISKREDMLLNLLKGKMSDYGIRLNRSFIYNIRWNKKDHIFNIYMIDHLYKNSKDQSFAISSWFNINADTKEIVKSKTLATDVTYCNNLSKTLHGEDFAEEIKMFKGLEETINKDVLEIFVKENIDTLLELCIAHLHTKDVFNQLDNQIQNVKMIGNFDRIYGTIRFNDFNDVGLHADLFYYDRDYETEHIIIPLRTDEYFIPYQEKNKILFKKEDMANLIKVQELLKHKFFKILN